MLEIFFRLVPPSFTCICEPSFWQMAWNHHSCETGFRCHCVYFLSSCSFQKKNRSKSNFMWDRCDNRDREITSLFAKQAITPTTNTTELKQVQAQQLCPHSKVMCTCIVLSTYIKLITMCSTSKSHSKPFPRPVFDHLQYVQTEGKAWFVLQWGTTFSQCVPTGSSKSPCFTALQQFVTICCIVWEWHQGSLPPYPLLRTSFHWWCFLPTHWQHCLHQFQNACFSAWQKVLVFVHTCINTCTHLYCSLSSEVVHVLQFRLKLK